MTSFDVDEGTSPLRREARREETGRHVGFVGSVAFAAVVGCGLPPVLSLLGASDPTTVAALYMVSTTVVYALLVGASRSARLAGVLLIGGGGLASVSVASSLFPTALTLTVVLAYCRSRILCRGSVPRPFRAEACIGVLALLAAFAVSSDSVTGIALGLWTYWLVQSGFFLFAEQRSRRSDGADPFDAAVGRATDLMDNLR